MFFGGFVRVNVGMGAQHPQWPAVGIAFDDLAHRKNPFPCARLGSLPEFHPVFGQAPGEVILVNLHDGIVIIGMQASDPGGIGLCEAFRVIAQHGGVFGADDGLAGLDIQIVDALVGGGQRQRQPFLGLE